MYDTFLIKSCVEKELLYRHCFSTCSTEPRRFAKGCVGFRQTEMHNGGRVWLAVLNSYVRIENRVVTFDTNHFVTDSTQTVNRSFNPEASWLDSSHSAQFAVYSRCVRRNDQVIDHFEVGRWFCTCSVHKIKRMLVFNCIFDVLWTRRGSSVSSVAFLVFHELK